MTAIDASGRPDLGKARVTWFGAFRAEWTKLWTIRSTYIVLFFAVFAMVGISALFAWGMSEAAAEGDMGAQAVNLLDTTWLSLQGIGFAQIAIGVLGALIVTSEYSTGMIRATFVAVPKRLPVLITKALLIYVVTLLVMIPTAFAAFLLAQTILDDFGFAASLSDPGVVRAIIGAGLYLAAVGVIGCVLGWLLRSAAGAVFALVTLVLILPIVLQFITLDWVETIYTYLPSTAGEAVFSLGQDAGLSLRDLMDADRVTFGPWEGYGILLAWALGGLAIATWSVMRRDA